MRENSVFLTLVQLALLVSAAQCLICLDGSTLDQYGVTCVCDDGLYNALEGKCQNACNYFGDNICGIDKYNHAKCIQDQSDVMSYSCECEEGYDDPDGDGRCTDLDECSNGLNSCYDSNHEECLNQVGYSLCKCKDGYYRSADGNCLEINPCLNPNDNICHMICNHTGPDAYECDCPAGFYMPAGTYDCVVENADDKCPEDDCGDHGSCMLVDKKKTCYPALGYEVNESGYVVDINECTGEFQCGINSYCSNKYGFYVCICNQYLVFSPSINECMNRVCNVGQLLYEGVCKDPCTLDYKSCPARTECQTDLNAVASCQCQINCQLEGSVEGSDAQFYIYGASFTVSYGKSSSDSNFIYNVTKSLESIFGDGNAQIASYTDSLSSVSVTFDLSLSTSLLHAATIEELLLNSCQPIEINSTETKCVLPAGTIINEEGIQTWSNEDVDSPCETDGDNLCPSDIQTCVDYSMDTRVSYFRCDCVEGYEEVQSSTGDNICIDIDECLVEMKCEPEYTCVNQPGNFTCIQEYDQDEVDNLENQIEWLENDIDYLGEDLDDAEHKTVVVGGVLGGLFAIALIGCLIFGIYSAKLKKRMKETV